MEITNLTSAQISKTTIRVSWESDSSLFYVWVNGSLYAAAWPQKSITVSVPVGGNVVVEVFTTSTEVSNFTFAFGKTVGWYPVTDATSYNVQILVDGAWETQASIAENGSAFYSWNTPQLDDCARYDFRVQSVSSGGVLGDVSRFTVHTCRYPDDPAGVFLYDEANGEVSIS